MDLASSPKNAPGLAVSGAAQSNAMNEALKHATPSTALHQDWPYFALAALMQLSFALPVIASHFSLAAAYEASVLSSAASLRAADFCAGVAFGLVAVFSTLALPFAATYAA